jgi:competence protein ComEA
MCPDGRDVRHSGPPSRPSTPVEPLDEPPAEYNAVSPARSPPVEASVEQSSPPWRVFDAPSGEQPAAGGHATGGHAAPDGRAGPRIAGMPLPVVAAVGAAIAIGGLAVAVALGSGGSAVVTGPGATLASEASEFGSGELIVDIAGAVVAPGVYHLATGSRIGDAIHVAGGFSPRVDADRVAAELNLAATLTDGQQVRVPSRDDDQVAGGSGDAGTGGAGGGTGSPIDLNSATQAELESLPGIGPVTAGKILQARTEAPFRTVDELRERGLVGEKTFDAIRALVTVG